MKRYIDITICILLSLLIIHMGTGVAVVQCMHHGEMMSMATVEKTKSMDHGCDKPLGKCMIVKVSKLSPTSVAQNFVHNFAATLPLLFINDCSLIVPAGSFRLSSQQIAEVMPHGPPLDYLHFIRILII